MLRGEKLALEGWGSIGRGGAAYCSVGLHHRDGGDVLGVEVRDCVVLKGQKGDKCGQVLGRLQVAVGLEARGRLNPAPKPLSLNFSPGERKFRAYDLHSLALHVLGKTLPAPAAAAPPPPPPGASAMPQPAATAFDVTRAPCALAAAVALLQLNDELGCIQSALNVAERSGFPPNLLMKSGLPGAALCMLQRCADARDKLLPFHSSAAASASAPPPSSSSPSSSIPLDHHLPSACICSADALGILNPCNFKPQTPSIQPSTPFQPV